MFTGSMATGSGHEPAQLLLQLVQAMQAPAAASASSGASSIAREHSRLFTRTRRSLSTSRTDDSGKRAFYMMFWLLHLKKIASTWLWLCDNHRCNKHLWLLGKSSFMNVICSQKKGSPISRWEWEDWPKNQLKCLLFIKTDSTWLSTVQQHLRHHNLTLPKAVDMAQNCPQFAP